MITMTTMTLLRPWWTKPVLQTCCSEIRNVSWKQMHVRTQIIITCSTGKLFRSPQNVNKQQQDTVFHYYTTNFNFSRNSTFDVLLKLVFANRKFFISERCDVRNILLFLGSENIKEISWDATEKNLEFSLTKISHPFFRKNKSVRIH